MNRYDKRVNEQKLNRGFKNALFQMNEISDAKNVKAKITCTAGQTTLDNQREIKVKRWRNYIFTSSVGRCTSIYTVHTLKSTKKCTFYILCTLE